MGFRRDALAWMVCACVACGPPPAPARPDGPVAEVKRYAPLTIREDAKAPGRAVLLGTHDDESTVLPLPVMASAGVVDVMMGDGLLAVRLRTAPNMPAEQLATATTPTTTTAQPPSVSTSSDATPAWHGQLWSAALAAADALGKDIGDVAVSAEPPVPDRVIASGLVAAGIIAVVTGENIDRAASVAGAVYPDGTLGAVPGLAEQFAGALARGKTRIGYPSGARVVKNAAGRDVDLAKLANEHGAQAIEVATVGEAYRLLTGAPLPATQPVADADMALEPEAISALGAGYLSWRKRVADEWAELLQLEQVGRLPAAVIQLVRAAQARSTEAEALHRGGQIPSAYSRMLGAWSYAAAANATHQVLVRVQRGDIDGAIALLPTPGAGADRTSAVLAKIGALHPATLAGHLAMIAAFQAALRGASLQRRAGEAIPATQQQLAELKNRPTELGAPATADAVAAAVVPGALLVFGAIAETAAAEQMLEGPIDRGVAYAAVPGELARLAATHEAAAVALAGALAARDAAHELEPSYLIARAAAQVGRDAVTHELVRMWGEGSTSASLLRIAGYTLARNAAALVAAAEHGPPPIAGARRAALAHARAARIAAGAIPAQAKLAYQIAAAAPSDAPRADTLDALAALWTASAISQLAVVLARNAPGAPAGPAAAQVR